MFNPNETTISEFLAAIVLIALGLIVAPIYDIAGAIIASLLGLASWGAFMGIRADEDLLVRNILFGYATMLGGAALLIAYLAAS